METNINFLNGDLLKEQVGLPGLRSLERSLHLWNIKKNDRIGLDDIQLVQHLWVLFYDMGRNDKEIIRFLALEGKTMSLRMYVSNSYNTNSTISWYKSLELLKVRITG